ncbi:hypothetical protein B0H66DRAFT_176214 [Apodospora peruviana]|uniref:Uncharacterized protein n=1 Tax=Apodospora peruviana TaxID=516989 RepID=A0AAE0IBF4_9PEZI|nr:hypothetical protein B0H66DRAFT_176214 [Apodospora peruviana]
MSTSTRICSSLQENTTTSCVCLLYLSASVCVCALRGRKVRLSLFEPDVVMVWVGLKEKLIICLVADRHMHTQHIQKSYIGRFGLYPTKRYAEVTKSKDTQKDLRRVRCSVLLRLKPAASINSRPPPLARKSRKNGALFSCTDRIHLYVYTKISPRGSSRVIRIATHSTVGGDVPRDSFPNGKKKPAVVNCVIGIWAPGKA